MLLQNVDGFSILEVEGKTDLYSVRHLEKRTAYENGFVMLRKKRFFTCSPNSKREFSIFSVLLLSIFEQDVWIVSYFRLQNIRVLRLFHIFHIWIKRLVATATQPCFNSRCKEVTSCCELLARLFTLPSSGPAYTCNRVLFSLSLSTYALPSEIRWFIFFLFRCLFLVFVSLDNPDPASYDVFRLSLSVLLV